MPEARRQRQFTGRRFEGLAGPLQASNADFERCTFDNCSAGGGVGRGIRLVGCAAWACSLGDVVLEDCLIENLATSHGGGGRTMPLFVWGGAMRRVTLRGTIGSLIWNPPRRDGNVTTARLYYEEVDDWSLDVREARFRSVPALRFGPPGRLIRRDPHGQPLIDRAHARLAGGAGGPPRARLAGGGRADPGARRPQDALRGGVARNRAASKHRGVRGVTLKPK